MPTYDYRCKSCDHAFELFQGMRDSVKRTCPACGKRTLKRLIGTGAAILVGGTSAPTPEETTSTSSSTDTKTENSSTAKEGEPKSQDTANSESTEKKTSGSTSTPTHEAREHRGVGNLVDAARRTRNEREASKKTQRKPEKKAEKKTTKKTQKKSAPQPKKKTSSSKPTRRAK